MQQFPSPDLNFIGSAHCKSRVHCDTCRNDRKFRENLFNQKMVDKIDFDCPERLFIGDKVEALLAPLVKALKKVGVNLSNCGGCKGRKDTLNKLTH